MMIMTLHPWEIKIDLGRIKSKGMLVLAMVDFFTKKRTTLIHVAMYKTRCLVRL